MFAVIRTFVLAGLLSAALTASSHAADSLTITLDSGRTFAGNVAATTSDEALVLRTEKGNVTLDRPITWKRIASARYDGTDVPLDQLPALAERIKLPASIRLPLASVSSAPSSAHEFAPTHTVAAIAFEATIANWDADVEADGVALRVFPLDAHGQLTPASGTLEVELFAPQRRTFHHAPQSGGYTTELVGRWLLAVDSSQVTRAGIVARLPFQALYPAFQHNLYWYGLLHVKLSVPGSGVFEQSQDGITLRGFTPLRDALEQTTGQRFLPSETTGRGKNHVLWRP